MRQLAIALLVLLVSSAPLAAQQRILWEPTPLLTDATTTVSGDAVKPVTPFRTFQVYGATTAGAGSATVVIEVSNVNTPGANDWITAGTVTLTLSTTRSTDGFVMQASWRNVRARVSAISGTGAAVSAILGS